MKKLQLIFMHMKQTSVTGAVYFINKMRADEGWNETGPEFIGKFKILFYHKLTPFETKNEKLL